jgi:hypothetical protein
MSRHKNQAAPADETDPKAVAAGVLRLTVRQSNHITGQLNLSIKTFRHSGSQMKIFPYHHIKGLEIMDCVMYNTNIA